MTREQNCFEVNIKLCVLCRVFLAFLIISSSTSIFNGAAAAPLRAFVQTTTFFYPILWVLLCGAPMMPSALAIDWLLPINERNALPLFAQHKRVQTIYHQTLKSIKCADMVVSIFVYSHYRICITNTQILRCAV